MKFLFPLVRNHIIFSKVSNPHPPRIFGWELFVQLSSLRCLLEVMRRTRYFLLIFILFVTSWTTRWSISSPDPILRNIFLRYLAARLVCATRYLGSYVQICFVPSKSMVKHLSFLVDIFRCVQFVLSFYLHKKHVSFSWFWFSLSLLSWTTRWFVSSTSGPTHPSSPEKYFFTVRLDLGQLPPTWCTHFANPTTCLHDGFWFFGTIQVSDPSSSLVLVWLILSLL